MVTCDVVACIAFSLCTTFFVVESFSFWDSFSFLEAFYASIFLSLMTSVIAAIFPVYPSVALLVPVASPDGVNQSLGHLLMIPIISSSMTKYENLCHVPMTSFFTHMDILWKALKSMIFVYCACRLGENHGFWLITIHNSESNKTQNILVSMMQSGSFVAHSEENFTALHKSGSDVGI